jgi:hypothetical protein
MVNWTVFLYKTVDNKYISFTHTTYLLILHLIWVILDDLK